MSAVDETRFSGPLGEAPDKVIIDDDLHLQATALYDLTEMHWQLEEDPALLAACLDRLHPVTAEEICAGYDAAMAAKPAGQAALYNIYVEDTMVGATGLLTTDTEGLALLEIWIDEPARGRGIATRAAQGLIDVVFSDSPIHRVRLGFGQDNDRGRELALRLGAHKLEALNPEAEDGFEEWEIRKDTSRPEAGQAA